MMNLLLYYSRHWLLFTTTLGQLRGGEDLPFTAAGHQGAIELTKKRPSLLNRLRVGLDKYTSQWFVLDIILCLLLAKRFLIKF